jgi:hypothetical protein
MGLIPLVGLRAPTLTVHMNAAAIASDSGPPASKPTLFAPPEHSAARPSLRDDPDAREVARARTERAVFRDAVVGGLLGALVLAPTWALLVILAIRNSGTALTAPAFMGAGVGVIAGVFMGGWAGTLVGSSKLEHFEHETRPRLPQPGQAH